MSQPKPMPPVYELNCAAAFEGLTQKERLYAHHLSNACYLASPIVLFQTSRESPLLFVFLITLFKHQDLEVSEELRSYAAEVFSNMGNYKSFGDTKITPENVLNEIEKLVELVEKQDPSSGINKLWSSVKPFILNTSEEADHLAFPPSGSTSYYSPNCQKEDAALVQQFMDEKGVSPYNTRLFKSKTGEYELRIASARVGPGDDPVSSLLKQYEYQNIKINITRGDYSPLMALAIEELKKALEFATDIQKRMIQKYIESFEYGSIDAHKDGSRVWVQDKGPVVESYIGFIESYRDPLGVRGEWEGFVAVVNKEVSKKYTKLVEQAESYLPLLPWPKEFEKDIFLRPDFTSLDVLSFAGSGIPAGINIPNYDDIRQSEGFKNVSLGNVLSARFGKEPLNFVTPEDQAILHKLEFKSFEVQVALHELLGHGSGKLFTIDAEGKTNFPQNLQNPLNNTPIDSYYTPGKTYDGVFAEMGSAFEECRAEAVGIYLCLSHEILSIFGHNTPEACEEIIYSNWLSMVRAGISALEFYTPESSHWRQAHMHARHVILRTLLEDAKGLVQISIINNNDLQISLDKSKINTLGKEAIGHLLKRMQVFKSTANYDAAKKMFNHYSHVEGEYLTWRKIVLEKKKPRPMYVQPGTKIEQDGTVSYVKYDATNNGIIKSFVDRFSGTEKLILDFFEKDREMFDL